MDVSDKTRETETTKDSLVCRQWTGLMAAGSSMFRSPPRDQSVGGSFRATILEGRPMPRRKAAHRTLGGPRGREPCVSGKRMIYHVTWAPARARRCGWMSRIYVNRRVGERPLLPSGRPRRTRGRSPRAAGFLTPVKPAVVQSLGSISDSPVGVIHHLFPFLSLVRDGCISPWRNDRTAAARRRCKRPSGTGSRVPHGWGFVGRAPISIRWCFSRPLTGPPTALVVALSFLRSCMMPYGTGSAFAFAFVGGRRFCELRSY